MKSLLPLLIITSIFAAIPAILIKSYVYLNNNYNKNNKEKIFLISLSMLSFFFLTLCYIELFSKYDLASGYASVKVLSIVLVLSMGFIFFNNTLSNDQIIGVILAILAIILLYPNNNKKIV